MSFSIDHLAEAVPSELSSQEGASLTVSEELIKLRDEIRPLEYYQNPKNTISTKGLTESQTNTIFRNTNNPDKSYMAVLNAFLGDLKKTPLFVDYTIQKLDGDILKGTLAFKQSGGDMDKFISNMKVLGITGKSVLPILMILGQWGGGKGYNYNQYNTIKSNPLAGSPQASNKQIFAGAQGEMVSGKNNQYKALCTGWHMLFEDVAQSMGIQAYTIEAHMNTNHLASMYKIDGQYVIQTWDRVFVGRSPSEVLMQYNRVYNSTNLVSRVYDHGKLVGEVKTPESTALQSHLSLGIMGGNTIDFDLMFQGNISTENIQKTSAGNVTAKVEQITADTNLQSAMLNFKDVYRLGEAKITTVSGIGLARLERAGVKLDMITAMAGFDATRDLYKGKDGMIYVREGVIAEGFLASRAGGDKLADQNVKLYKKIGGKYAPTGTSVEGGIGTSMYISPKDNKTPGLGLLTPHGNIVQNIGSGQLVLEGSQSPVNMHATIGYTGKIRDNTTFALSGSSDTGKIWVNPEVRQTFSGNITHDFRTQFIDSPGNTDAWVQFCKKYGIDTTGMDISTSEGLQVAEISFVLANSKTFLQDELVSKSDLVRANITLEGGKISINPESLLSKYIQGRLSIGIQSGGMMNNGVSLGSNNYIKAGSDISQSMSQEGMIYADWSQFFARYEIKKNMITTSDGDVYRGIVNMEGGRQYGKVFAGGGIGGEKVSRDGSISGGTLGMSTAGPTIAIRDGSLHLGGENQEIQLSLGGIRVIMTKNPGKSLATKTGEIYEQYEGLYQFLSKSPADKVTVRHIMELLKEIGDNKTLTISDDFARSLKPRIVLKQFEKYIEINKDIFRDASVKSIHFESKNDWIGAFRGTEGTDFNNDIGHLLIRSIDGEKPLSLQVLSTHSRNEYLDEVQTTQALLHQNGIKIRSDRPLTESEIQQIATLIDIAKRQGYEDRMKNMTIQFHGKGETISTPMKWNEKNRILEISLATLAFVPPSENLGIEGIVGDEGKRVSQFITENEIKNLNNIELIDENDKRFLTTDREQSFSGVKNINGKTYVYRKDFTEMMRLSDKSKTPEGLGFFDRQKLSTYISQWNNASIYSLNQFDSFLQGKMSDLNKSVARVALHGGDGTLQGLIPMGDIKISNSEKTLSFSHIQVNTKEKVGEVKVTVGTGEIPSINITTSQQVEGKQTTAVYTVDVNHPTKTTWEKMKREDPELYTIIVEGAHGVNITTGKPERIIGVLEKLFFAK